jgi:predicted component of type VI protein secretion system
MKVVLELQDQPSNIRRITVRHDIVIGRGSDCNLRLSAPQVSRRHCFLRVGRDSVSVTDLDSSNGTYVNGARITAGKRYDIADGSQLALGPIRFIIHMRAETEAAESAKLKMAAGAAHSGERAGAHGESAPHRTTADASSSAGRRSRLADSDVPMDYNMEQAGDSAEPHEPTHDNLVEAISNARIGELDSSGSDLMDSRLEIIDFGRRLSGEGLNSDENGAASQGDACQKSETTADSEPTWESAIIDSSESPDDLDLLGISAAPIADCCGDRPQMHDSESPIPGDDCLAIDDSIDTVYPQPSSDSNATACEQTYVVADDFLDVDVADDVPYEIPDADDMECADAEIDDVFEAEEIFGEVLETSDEILEVADEVLEEDSETHWFTEDADDERPAVNEPVSPTDEASGKPVQSTDDQIDPDLQSFLKGF